MTRATLTFEDGSASVESIRAVADESWAELRNNPRFQARILSEDLNPESLNLDARSPFEIQSGSSGFEPFGTAILIGVGAWATQVAAGVAEEMLLDLWREFILPRIKDRLGSDAIGPERPE